MLWYINSVYFFPLALTRSIFISIELILSPRKDVCLTLACTQVREDDQSGDGIESVINKVEVYLAEGKLAEAAACLEESVRGTQAAEIVAGWVRQARNRAISEQAVLLLQSYANSLSFTWFSNFEYLQNHVDSIPKVAKIILGGLCPRELVM